MKRQKLLVLLAAYHDSGVSDPSMRMLARRLKLNTHAVDGLLMRLETDGFIAVDWAKRGSARNRYTLTCIEHPMAWRAEPDPPT